MRGPAIVAALALTAACSDDGPELAPPPATVTAGPLTITTAPLTLAVAAPRGGAYTQGAFVEVATVPTVDATRYYDPVADGADPLTWRAATRATGITADGWLVLDNGARLRVAAEAGAADAALELDASAVDGAVLARVVLPMTAGEPLFGFGETFESADASGQLRELQFRPDARYESGINEAHVPVPLAMWPSRGVGWFVRDRRVGAFDLGATRPGEVLATFGLPERGPLRFELFTAAEPLDLVRAYVAATARPALPPRWAFAPQQWRNEHRSTAELLDDARQMRALGIPGSTMWIDNPWQTGYNTFVVDETRFAGIDAALAELAALGYRVLVWSTPYLLPSGATADDYRTAAAAGLFVTDARGQPMSFPWNAGPVGMIDFTNPAAVDFWRARIARITARGVSGMKLDYGEDLVADLYGTRIELRTMAGDNQDLHGIFARYYHDTYLGALPPGDGFLITRAGAWGEQDRNTAIWPGDLDSDFSRHGVDNGDGERNTGGLPAAIAGGLALSVSGYPFYGSDIGGYREGTPTSEVLIRWAQYAALGTIMQLGGGGPSHNPWDTALYPAPALEVYRTFARLHLDLNPLVWTLAVTAAADGTPVTRPCRFVYPGAACDDAMFLLGDAIVAAPVVTAGATTRSVVLPPGRWIDWWTGAAITGDGTTAHDAAAPLERLPLWRAADRFVPMFARAADTLAPATAPGVTSYADPAYGRELRLWLTPDGGVAEVALHDGAQARAEVVGGAYRLRFEPGSQYTVATFDLDTTAALATQVAATTAVTVDGVAAPAVADGSALASCPTACWLAEPTQRRLRIRVVAAAPTEIVLQ
jgi:alpha-D-xyloside xylohydrolase